MALIEQFVWLVSTTEDDLDCRMMMMMIQNERIFQKPMNLVDHEVIDFKVLAMSSLSLLDVFQHGGDDDGDEEEDFSNSTF